MNNKPSKITKPTTTTSKQNPPNNHLINSTKSSKTDLTPSSLHPKSPNDIRLRSKSSTKPSNTTIPKSKSTSLPFSKDKQQTKKSSSSKPINNVYKMKKLFTPSSSANPIVNEYKSYPSTNNNNNTSNKAKIKLLSIDNTNDAALCIQKQWKKHLLNNNNNNDNIVNNNDIPVSQSKTPPNENITKPKAKTTVHSESKPKISKQRPHSKPKLTSNLSNKLKCIKNPLECIYVIDNIYKRKIYKYKLQVFQKFKEIQLISQFKSKFKNYPSVKKALSKNNIAKTTDNVLSKIKNSIQHKNLPGTTTFKKRSLKQGMRKLQNKNDNHIINNNPLRRMYIALYWIKWVKRVYILRKFEHDERNKHKVKRILLQQQVNPIRKYFIVKYLKTPFELIKSKAFKTKVQP